MKLKNDEPESNDFFFKRTHELNQMAIDDVEHSATSVKVKITEMKKN